MVAIPAGEFTRGSPESEPSRKPDEGPPRAVTVGPFWMGACEVTWDEYLPFQEAVGDRFRNGSLKTVAPETQPVDLVSSPTIPYTSMDFGMGLDGYPATSMTTHAALKYCQWLSTQTGHFYRLPTEAEWEYACRAGTTTRYPSGHDPQTLGKVGELVDATAKAQIPDWKYMIKHSDNYAFTSPVGKSKANLFGLYDMHGNAFQWCADWYGAEYYGTSPADDPTGPESGTDRIIRGGTWSFRPLGARSAERSWTTADSRNCSAGFRVVRAQ